MGELLSFINLKDKRLFVEFTTPKRWKIGAWLIRLYERTPYSHVRIRYINTDNKPVIVEANGRGVIFKGPEADRKDPQVVVKRYCLLLNITQFRRFRNLSKELAGTKYGYFQLLSIFFTRIFKRKRPLIQDNGQTMVCSELVTILLADILPVKPSVDQDLITPRDLDLFLKMCQNNSNLLLLFEKG